MSFVMLNCLERLRRIMMKLNNNRSVSHYEHNMQYSTRKNRMRLSALIVISEKS